MLTAAAAFALSTLFAKRVTMASEVSGLEITLTRFILGFVLVYLFIHKSGKSLKPVRFRYIFLRATTNMAAVGCFFMGVQFSTVTKANLLNMTYPVFVFLFSPFINKERSSRLYILFLALAITGVYYVVVPEQAQILNGNINTGDLLALISGLIAGFSISFLRESRKYDDSYLILFYLMGIGTVLNLIVVVPVFVIPPSHVLPDLFLSALTAVSGQAFITAGYRYISASGGALVSTSRILFAMALGILFLGELLTLRIITGTACILVALAGVSGFFRIPLYLNKKSADS